MTQDELRAKFGVAYKIITREKRWRNHVFPDGHPKREEKLREMDRLLEVLTELKDALKPHCEAAMEQAPLLDVPAESKERRAEFN